MRDLWERFVDWWPLVWRRTYEDRMAFDMNLIHAGHKTATRFEDMATRVKAELVVTTKARDDAIARAARFQTHVENLLGDIELREGTVARGNTVEKGKDKKAKVPTKPPPVSSVRPGVYPGTKHSKKTVNGKRTWK